MSQRLTNKKSIRSALLRTLLILAVVACVGVACFFILRACGFTSAEDFAALRDELGDGIAFWAVIVGLQIIQAVFLQCSNSLITAPVSLLFTDSLWKVFLSSFIGIFIGNMILYAIGRFCGGKLLKFVLGDEEKAENLKESMRSGKWFYLCGCVCPFIPSDVLNTLAGASKYNFWFVLISTFFTRAICVATTTWVVGLIPKYPWMIAVLVVLIVGMIAAAIILTKKQFKSKK